MAFVVLADRVGFFGLPSQQRQVLEFELAEAVRDIMAQRALREPSCIVSEEEGAFALVFFGDGETAAEAAQYLFRSLRTKSRAPLRIGCHYGPLIRQRNALGKWIVWGAALSEGRRIMACCDGTSAIASEAFAEQFAESANPQCCFSGVTEREVIQGEVLRICSFKTNDEDRSFPSRRKVSEATGGAVPLDSHFYIERETDSEFRRAVSGGESIVLVKGARQIGKTSLLARALNEARTAGLSVVLTDFQAFGAAELNDSTRLYRLLADEMSRQLGLDADIREHWDDLLGPNTNLERFLVNVVLSQRQGQIVWAMDEVDRLFTAPFGGDFFGLVRSWHNRRALDASSPWLRLTLAIAHATEAHLFISDLNQSPFNVGMRLELEDFSLKETSELNRRYGGPLSTEGLARFYELTGGQPFLCRRGFEVLLQRSIPLTQFAAIASDEDGPFSDHLRRLLEGVNADRNLRTELREKLQGSGKLSRETFFRLRSAGVVRGDAPDRARIKCEIYRDFLTRHLAN